METAIQTPEVDQAAQTLLSATENSQEAQTPSEASAPLLGASLAPQTPLPAPKKLFQHVFADVVTVRACHVQGVPVTAEVLIAGRMAPWNRKALEEAAKVDPEVARLKACAHTVYEVQSGIAERRSINFDARGTYFEELFLRAPTLDPGPYAKHMPASFRGEGKAPSEALAAVAEVVPVPAVAVTPAAQVAADTPRTRREKKGPGKKSSASA